MRTIFTEKCSINTQVQALRYMTKATPFLMQVLVLNKEITVYLIGKFYEKNYFL